MVCQICQNQTWLPVILSWPHISNKRCPLQVLKLNLTILVTISEQLLARPQLISHSAAPGEVYLIGDYAFNSRKVTVLLYLKLIQFICKQRFLRTKGSELKSHESHEHPQRDGTEYWLWLFLPGQCFVKLWVFCQHQGQCLVSAQQPLVTLCREFRVPPRYTLEVCASS